ncbi:MAG: aml, partial [Myxococcaceae bacterium]|nr:aml [Myxococcaceae bacterium]
MARRITPRPPPPVRPPAAPVTPAPATVTAPARTDGFAGLQPAKIETVFTPGDEAMQMELAELDAIIAARAADPKIYPPGQNPYRIEYAIYNMTDPPVIRRLTDAARAGVKVQVLIDAHQISPDRPWNTVAKELVSAGFTHAESNKGLTAEQARETQLIEVDMGQGLFHLKSRHFSYPDPVTGLTKETLLTGSYNPQNSAHQNDESFHRITDPGLIKKYVGAIESLRDNKPVQNTWEEGAPLNVLFSSPTAKGPRVSDKIFDLIKNENELIFLSVFTLRNITDSQGQARLVDELAKAQARGVKVMVITDHKQADGVDTEGNARPDANDDNTEDLLRAKGIPTFEVTNTDGPFNAMHLKSAVFGLTDMKVVTDAGNWTYATMGSKKSPPKNAESVLFIDSGKADQNETGKRYLGEFMRVMRRYADQDHGGPEAERAISELQRLPGWPKVKVNFDVLARTNWGQDVFLVGNTPELGSWGVDGPGVKLSTEAGTYPDWKARDFELPLGLRLEYKIAKRDGQGRV